MSLTKDFFGVVLLLGLVLVDKTTSNCLPVYESDVRNFTPNTSLIIDYHLPNCPPNFILAKIIAATISPVATNEIFNITGNLTACLDSCKIKNSSCTCEIRLKGLLSDKMTSGNKSVEIAVNYKCQAVPFLKESSLPVCTTSVTRTEAIAYLPTEMTNFGQDWVCTISTSSTDASIAWRWVASGCSNQALECSGGNGNEILPLNETITSTLCMKAQSVTMIRFPTDIFHPCLLNILLDIQTNSGSDLRVQCSSEAPVIPGLKSVLDQMKEDCNQLTWTAVSPPPTYGQLGTVSTATATGPASVATVYATSRLTISSDSVSVATAAVNGVYSRPTPGFNTQELALGIGVGVGGGLVVLVCLVLAIVCLRKSRLKKRGSTIKEESVEAEDNDGGFVSANDVFVCRSFYETIPPSAFVPEAKTNNGSVDLSNNNERLRNDSPGNELSENNTQSPLTSPGVSEGSPVNPSGAEQGKTKKCRTLTKKVFTQIAEAAKQEEKNKQKNKRKSDVSKMKSNEQDTTVEPTESPYVDVWLYSSTLDGVNAAYDTINASNDKGVHIARRFEIDL